VERFDLDCRCGHLIKDHGISGCFVCYEGLAKDLSRYDKGRHNFKLDNLKYLEMLSKEKEIADLK
jgi:hypothetical protein